MQFDTRVVSTTTPDEPVPTSIDPESDRWFATPPANRRSKSSHPPAPPEEERISVLLGDPFADSWFKRRRR